MNRLDKIFIVRHLNDCLNELAGAKKLCEKLRLTVLMEHLNNIEKAVDSISSEILLIE